MNYFGIHLSDIDSERFISASNDQIAAWLFLHAYCCKQRNSGRIENAAAFDARFWGRLGIDRLIVTGDCPLWTWIGDDLVLQFYDLKGQTIYEQKVAGGRAGGKAKAENQRASSTPSEIPKEIPSSTPSESPPTPDPTRPNLTLEETSSLFAPNGTSSVSKQIDIGWDREFGFTGITDKDRSRWKDAYPAVDLDRQIAASSEWLRSNPAKRKKDFRRFLTGWLARAQERGGDIPSVRPASQRAHTSQNVPL